MQITDELKKQIKTYLRKRRLKAYELAIKAKVPQACIYEFLRGKQGLTLKTMEKIQRAMR